MATEKDSFATPATLVITLASLASSASGVGRQSTLVDNTTTGYPSVIVFYKVKLGTSPTGDTLVVFYLIRNESTDSIADDSAGASDAGISVLNALPIATATTKASPSTGDVLEGSFTIPDVGPSWGIAVVQSTGAALDSTGSNHKITFVGINPTFA